MARVYGETTPLSELFSQVGEQAGTLVREEVELARTELTHTAKRAGKGAALLAAGALLGYAGLLSFIATCIILLARAVAWWISALVITGVVVAGALILVSLGLNAIKREPMTPEHTLQTLREDVQWAKSQTK